MAEKDNEKIKKEGSEEKEKEEEHGEKQKAKELVSVYESTGHSQM